MTYCVSGLNTHKPTFQSQHSPHVTPESCAKNLNSFGHLASRHRLQYHRNITKWSQTLLKVGKRYFTLSNTTHSAALCREGMSNKVLTESIVFSFFSCNTSVLLPSGHLSSIPAAIVIRYVNDLSLSQMQQINQGQWVLFQSRMGEGGETLWLGYEMRLRRGGGKERKDGEEKWIISLTQRKVRGAMNDCLLGSTYEKNSALI